MSSIDGPYFQFNSKIFALGVIISAMLYGGVATLALTYIPLLLKTSHTISRRMRNFLLAYVTFMVATSTINTVTLIIAFTIGHSIFNFGSLLTEDEFAILGFAILGFPNGFFGSLCVTFASWGADGFMVSSRDRMLPSIFLFPFYIFCYYYSYGDARCYMKEFRDLGDWQSWPFLSFWPWHHWVYPSLYLYPLFMC